MNKIIILIAVITIGFWFVLNRSTPPAVTDKTEEAKPNLLAEYLPKEKPQTEELFPYTAESDNQHIVLNIGKFNFEFNKSDDPYETSLVVKNGPKTMISKSYPDTVLNISKILFKDKILILVNYYSGGAHCCSIAIPYLLDGEKVTEGESLDLGNIDIFNGDTFFIKDGKLMTISTDDRFAYYEMSYADSGIMFYPSFYEFSLDTLEFINRDDLFTDLYSKYYSQSQSDTKLILTSENCAKDEVGKYPVFGELVSRYIFGFLAGTEREKLKTELASDWWCFKEKDLAQTEDSIYQKLAGTSTEDFQSDTVQRYYE